MHGAVEQFGCAVRAAQGGFGQAVVAVEFAAVHPPGPCGVAGAGRVGEQFGRGAQAPPGLRAAAEAGECASGADVEDGRDAAGEVGAGQDGGAIRSERSGRLGQYAGGRVSGCGIRTRAWPAA
ncbi:hypothetical protein GCM10009731_12060 [Streptomyces globosus]